MKSSMAEVKNILENYHFIEMQIRNGMLDEEYIKKVRFVENCIKGLSGDDYKLMIGLYFEKCKLNSLKNSMYISSSTIYYRRNNIIKQIATLFDEKLGTFRKI